MIKRKRMIKRISDEEKRIMELLYLENISVQEISGYLHCNRSTVYEFAHAKGWNRKSIEDVLKVNKKSPSD